MMRRWRSLPDIRKPVVDGLEVEYEAARALFPEMTLTFSEWLEALLVQLAESLREARLAEERSRRYAE